MQALNNRGNSLKSLAALLMQQKELKSAIVYFGMTLSSWERSLQIVLGNTQLRQCRDELASYLQSFLDHVQSAITARSATVQQNPDDLEVLTNQADMLTLLAKLQVALLQTDAAIESYTSVVALYRPR